MPLWIVLFAALPLLAWSAALVPLLALALLLRARRKLSFVLLAASCVMAGWSDAALRAQALIVPHHGSKTPSTPEFLRAVDPKIVVYPVGYPTRFGHSHADVQERFLPDGSPV